MMVKNVSKKTVLSKNVKIAKSFWDKSFGMLLKKNSGGIVFETRFGVHTFFMKNNIDVLILDEYNKTAVIKTNLKPNRIFLWNPRFNKIIELPSGSIKKSKTGIGDELSIKGEKTIV